jgi:cytochrome c556
MKKCNTVSAVLAGVLLAAALPALAAQMSPEKSIKTRQSAFFLMGQQMGHINATVKGELPFDKPNLLASAELLELLSRVAVQNFPAGSDQGMTKAKPEVWKDTGRFRQLADDMTAETTKLRTAINGGDLAQIKAAYGSTGHSCKSCHDAFKQH